MHVRAAVYLRKLYFLLYFYPNDLANYIQLFAKRNSRIRARKAAGNPLQINEF